MIKKVLPSNAKQVMLVEENKSFESLREAARYMMEIGKCRSKDVHEVAKWIKLAASRGTTAYGLHWNFMCQCDRDYSIVTKRTYLQSRYRNAYTAHCQICGARISRMATQQLCRVCSTDFAVKDVI